MTNKIKGVMCCFACIFPILFFIVLSVGWKASVIGLLLLFFMCFVASWMIFWGSKAVNYLDVPDEKKT